MKCCLKCGGKFTHKEKIKAFNRKGFEIHCAECGSKYRKNNRIISGLSIFFTGVLLLPIGDELKNLINSSSIRSIIVFFSAIFIMLFITLVFNSFVKYERVE